MQWRQVLLSQRFLVNYNNSIKLSFSMKTLKIKRKIKARKFIEENLKKIK